MPRTHADQLFRPAPLIDLVETDGVGSSLLAFCKQSDVVELDRCESELEAKCASKRAKRA